MMSGTLIDALHLIRNGASMANRVVLESVSTSGTRDEGGGLGPFHLRKGRLPRALPSGLPRPCRGRSSSGSGFPENEACGPCSGCAVRRLPEVPPPTRHLR